MKKAYDRVWRSGLWKMLWEEGVRGKMWRVIRNMYKNTQNCVLTGNEKTEFFSVDVGVRQGCVLSPTLFSIYVNGLAKKIIESGIGIEIEGKKIPILLYADDIVIIADSIKELKKRTRDCIKMGEELEMYIQSQ